MRALGDILDFAPPQASPDGTKKADVQIDRRDR
jgi:hypothetical protein